MSDKPDLPIGRRFEKGKSGNPGGRAKGLGRLRALAQSHSPEAVYLLRMAIWGGPPPPLEDVNLAEIPVESPVPWPTRQLAAQSLLDRGFGKPVQAVEIDANIKRDLTEWSTEELEALAAAGGAMGAEPEEGSIH